jgi:dolichyl-diphosphooligosaccharide--protein glycosyltransferase
MTVRKDIGWLLLIAAVALAIRIYFPWPLVFTSAHVNLLESDAWYHLRVIENLAARFPHRLMFDPYALPSGQFVQVPPLLDFIVAGTAWIAGWGHPSEALIGIVAVFAPPVLGALTVIVVYSLAKLAAGRTAGLLAAAMAAILPGHFLDRTLLGFVDHHALESFVSVVVLWLVARPLARARSAWRSGLWLGAGLVAFRLAWTSSAMFVAVLVAWLAVHAALQSWRRDDVGGIARVVGIAALVAMPFTWVFESIEPFRVNLHVASLLILASIAGVVELGRYGLSAGWWPGRRMVFLGLAAAVVIGAGFFLLFPETAGITKAELSRFTFAPTDSSSSVTEARPLLTYGGAWSLAPAWGFFRSGFILGIIAIVFLAVRWFRHGRPLDLLLAVWTAAMFVATIGINRFGYYLVPAIAVVGGITCAALIETARQFGAWWRRAAVIAVAAGVFGVNLVPAIATTTRPPGIPAAWLPAFDWLRRQSDEPFGDPNYYYARYEPGTIRRATTSVMLWWDYGYTLMAAAHRVPTAIPTGGGGMEAAQFFMAVDESKALDVLATQRARYVFVDEYLPFSVQQNGELFGKFEAIVKWNGTPTGRYYDTFLIRQKDTYESVYLFFEDYYRSMTFRLGVLGGQATSAESGVAVVSWTIENVPGFGYSRVVSSLQPYKTYEEASGRLKQLGPGNHAIVGQDPRASPIPMAPLTGLRRVFATPAPGLFGQGAAQVFERF